jgi:mRNA interferase RelE/StbE
MKYRIILTKTAHKDLAGIPVNISDSIDRKIHSLEDGLPGSVKKLQAIDFGYRMRLADYRILFDLEGDIITIQRVLHRRHAYTSPGRGQKRQKGQH